jgi:ParB family chromosome partitioning protein
MIGLEVEIKTKSKGGEIKIKFSHPDELDSLLKKLDL